MRFRELLASEYARRRAANPRYSLRAFARGVDGGVWPSGHDVPNFVQLFIQVEDVDAMIAKATSAGAKVLVPKSALPDGDTMAVLLDPPRDVVCVMARRADSNH